MKNVQKIKNTLAKKLLKDDNVTGIDIGYKIKGGQVTEELAIRVFVRNKIDKSKLKKGQIIPKSTRNIKTDVIEGQYSLQRDRNWARNAATDLKQYEILKGGIQIATRDGETGTLGMIVKDNKTGKPAILTNRHVFGHAKPGDPIYQPNEQSQNIIANITRVGGDTSTDETTYIDAGIATILDGVKISNEIVGIGEIEGLNPIDDSEFEKYSVSKSGRTTRLTHGYTVGMRGTHKVIGRNEVLYASNCIDIKPDIKYHGKFSYSGDSGSVIVDDDNRVMALLFGGSDTTGTTTAIPIEKVFETLDISLLTQEEIDAWNNDRQPLADTVPGQPSSEPNPASFDAFKVFIESLELRHFSASELWIRGKQHANPNSPAFQLNTHPPHNLWNNIVPAIQALDELRERIKAPVRIISAYRSVEYNTAIGGSSDSRHVAFNALDFTVFDGQRPMGWAGMLEQLRDEGFFKGGIGIYLNFVHIDARGYNADWSNLFV